MRTTVRLTAREVAELAAEYIARARRTPVKDCKLARVVTHRGEPLVVEFTIEAPLTVVREP
jgi:hypothetical protein